MDYNKIVLIGRLGMDPKSIQTKTGTTMCKLRMATSEMRKGTGDAPVEITQWHDVLVFGKSASNCLQYLAKGREVWVEGRLEYKARKIGEVEVKEASIVAESVGFIGGKVQKKEVSSNPYTKTNTGTVVISAATGDAHANTTHEVLVEQELQDE